jgi:MFS family permease
MMAFQTTKPAGSAGSGWLNRNVIGMAVTSLCADACYEMVTAVLPGFLGTIGVAATALGWIEGAADALSSFVKLGMGWYSDRIGSRKTIVTVGYFLAGTALSVFALAASWPLVLLGRAVAWLGRGARGPLRDAMLSESVDPRAVGKAFGLHRAADTLGAVIGPLIGVGLLSMLPAASPSEPFRIIFVISLIPGVSAAAVFWTTVKELRAPGRRKLGFFASLRNLPRGYTQLLRGVGLFGLGDFSHTLLILAAGNLLAPYYGVIRAAQIAALLYALRNLLYAGFSFPIGALGDRRPKKGLLAAGYFLGGVTALGAAGLFAFHLHSIRILAALFAAAGIYIAAEDALEGAITADFVPREARGAAYGLLGAVNGVGDLAASALVGTIWTALSPAAAFCCAGFLMLSGAALLATTPPSAYAYLDNRQEEIISG